MSIFDSRCFNSLFQSTLFTTVLLMPIHPHEYISRLLTSRLLERYPYTYPARPDQSFVKFLWLVRRHDQDMSFRCCYTIDRVQETGQAHSRKLWLLFLLVSVVLAYLGQRFCPLRARSPSP